MMMQWEVKPLKIQQPLLTANSVLFGFHLHNKLWTSLGTAVWELETLNMCKMMSHQCGIALQQWLKLWQQARAFSALLNSLSIFATSSIIYVQYLPSWFPYNQPIHQPMIAKIQSATQHRNAKMPELWGWIQYLGKANLGCLLCIPVKCNGGQCKIPRRQKWQNMKKHLLQHLFARAWDFYYILGNSSSRHLQQTGKNPPYRRRGLLLPFCLLRTACSKREVVAPKGILGEPEDTGQSKSNQQICQIFVNPENQPTTNGTSPLGTKKHIYSHAVQSKHS